MRLQPSSGRRGAAFLTLTRAESAASCTDHKQGLNVKCSTNGCHSIRTDCTAVSGEPQPAPCSTGQQCLDGLTLL